MSPPGRPHLALVPSERANSSEPPAGSALPASPALRLPGEHFAAAFTFFALGTLCLAYIAPELASGAFLVRHVTAVVHLFTLGFISTSIIGALYQFLPVAVGTPIRSERLAHVTFALLAAGIPVFVTALAEPFPRVVPVGAGTVALGLLCFACNLTATLICARERNVTFWALAGASIFLLLTLAFGFVLAINLDQGSVGSARFELLLVHVHVALVGWVMLVMVGVAHRLLPMFMLSHGATEKPAQVAVAFLVAGCALLALPLGRRPHTAAFLVIGGGVIAFLTQAAAFYRHRRKRSLDPGLNLALCGLAGVGVALVMAPLALTRGFRDVRLITAYVFVLVVGGISLFIAGHYFKIVPFLVWNDRFSPYVGKRPVPRVADLYSARAAKVAVAVLVAATPTTALGILVASTALVRTGALGLFAGAMLEAREMLRVATTRPT